MDAIGLFQVIDLDRALGRTRFTVRRLRVDADLRAAFGDQPIVGGHRGLQGRVGDVDAALVTARFTRGVGDIGIHGETECRFVFFQDTMGQDGL